MIEFLRKWFRPAPRAPSPAAAAGGAGVRPDESAEALYDEFCWTFCHRPGVNFMDLLRAEDVTRLIAWLQPTMPDPLPKAFIRLAVDATRKGQKFWEKQGITLLYEGPQNQCGPPARESQDALSVLAQILGKPIKVYYKAKPGEPASVMEFTP
jgi:hypothetical protein